MAGSLRTRSSRRRIAGVIAAIVVAASSIAWWSVASASGRSPVIVRIGDFKIHHRVRVTDAGVVTLHVTNAGPSTHEINVDRTTLAAGDLPIGRDGINVDEDAPELHRIGSIEKIRLGESGDLTLRLPPGHYVLWCNLEGHYLGGMRSNLDVKATP
jgi:uncharacterized cupredoxin-like copper-binding protein